MRRALEALGAFVVKEFRHILRDRQTLIILLGLPVAQLILFGFALRTDVRDIRLAFVAQAPDYETAALRTRFERNGRFTLVDLTPAPGALDAAFRSGRADVALVIAPGLAAGLRGGEPVELQVIADASDPNTGSTMQTHVLAVLRAWEQEVTPRAAGVTIEPRIRMLFNPTLESVNLFVPGLIAPILTIVTALMTAISLSRERERGTMEVLLVSPLHPWQVIVGKVAPYLLLAFVNVVSVLVAAWLVFGVPFRGALVTLMAGSTLYAMVGLALGVLIAAVTSSQLSAMLAALMGTMMPSTLLSGMIFPIPSMPTALQLLSHLVPARWFIEISRGVMLKGAGWTELWPQFVILALMFTALVSLAIRKFSVRLD
ncbi:MAG: ABC transporter permease [Gemmatimonadaceae bacterium]|nr:ABC transporter permease [Gemmatimonadaceae bacterium]MCW5826045.1 ABC transporter permease [Gemmatimonadaceae bacterium]